jgi:hypothetical protein
MEENQDIELYRNPEYPKNGLLSAQIIYYLCYKFFRRFLHTVEVRGSSPLSPTIFLSTPDPEEYNPRPGF